MRYKVEKNITLRSKAKLPNPNPLETFKWAKNPTFNWLETSLVRNWQVRDWVFHCNKKPESVINYILKVVYFD